jgi:hypothetical protein
MQKFLLRSTCPKHLQYVRALRTFLLIASCLAAAQLAPDEIIRRSIAANEKDWNEGPSFSHLDRTIERKAEGTTDHTYQVTMMEGSPYRRLVAIDGQSLNAVRQHQEDQKERHELARRRSETRDERDFRIRKYEKDREQDHLLMTQMAVAFNFRLAGDDTIYGHPVYVLDAEPKPDYKPVNREAKVLTGMRGRLWVEKQRFHWVKVQAEVIHPVSFGGFLAKVGPGTKFELDKEPISGEIWEPKEFSVQVNASVLFWSHNSSTTDVFSDYHKESIAGNSPSVAGMPTLIAPPFRSFQLELKSQKIEQVLQRNDRKKPVVIDDHQPADTGLAHFR